VHPPRCSLCFVDPRTTANTAPVRQRRSTSRRYAFPDLLRTPSPLVL
jgi:hypothetical protein